MTVSGLRPKQVNIRLAPDEYDVITAKAAEVDMTVTEWIRLAALQRPLPRRDPRYARMVALLSNIAGNLNQLAAHANRGAIPGRDAIAATLAAVRAWIAESREPQ